MLNHGPNFDNSAVHKSSAQGGIKKKKKKPTSDEGVTAEWSNQVAPLLTTLGVRQNLTLMLVNLSAGHLTLKS